MITDAEIGKCFRYAFEVTEQTAEYYKKRNKRITTEKLVYDHFIAKLCEIKVWHFLTELEYVCSYPEFTLRKTEQGRIKKFTNDTDLVVFKDEKKLNIHIKCVRSDSTITDSWLIEKKDSCVHSPKPDEFFALCVFHSPEKIMIAKFVAAEKILWREPKANLPTKLACYLSDF